MPRYYLSSAGRIVLVLEQCMDSHNHQAVLRTAEALGVQHVWLVNANDRQVKKHKKNTDGTLAGQKKITKNCAFWLSTREFSSIGDCITALRGDGCTIWATDLAPDALPLTPAAKPAELPAKLAIVIGRETDGVSAEMLRAADQRVYFPIFGFTESLNLSVATALVLQRLFDWFPDVRGDLSDAAKDAIRAHWFPQLTRNATQTQHWVANGHAIPPLEDLRREKLAYHESWIPKSVRARESQMPEVQERQAKQHKAVGDGGGRKEDTQAE
jgi:tRNA C32,U32 (ribose-2'-O)-methylase TrmJ